MFLRLERRYESYWESLWEAFLPTSGRELQWSWEQPLDSDFCHHPKLKLSYSRYTSSSRKTQNMCHELYFSCVLYSCMCRLKVRDVFDESPFYVPADSVGIMDGTNEGVIENMLFMGDHWSHLMLLLVTVVSIFPPCMWLIVWLCNSASGLLACLNIL